MDARFDEEFYKSSWQRVLPLGPDGIQPYVRASRPSRLPGVPADMARLIATLDTLAQGVIAFGRRSANGVSNRPLLLASAPRVRRQRPWRRLAHEAAHPIARRTTRLLPKAASAPRISGRPAQVWQKELKQLCARADIIAKHTGTMPLRRSGSSGASPDME
jgi:hypothetical protein